MRQINICNAKISLSSLIKAVQGGEQVIITNRNRPVARLVAFEAPRQRPVFGSAAEALARSGLGRDDLRRALAPMTGDELAEWGLR